MSGTDLEVSRLFAAPPAKVWRCLTEPDLVCRWWTPAPVTTTSADIGLYPGGAFRMTFVMPDHPAQVMDFCILHVDPGRRLVWTDLMSEGLRPAKAMFGFAAITSIAAEGTGTRYRAQAMHRSAEGAENHVQAGFHEGWGAVADQLGKVAEGI